MISEFCITFRNTIGGKYDPNRGSKIQRELTGGAKIKLLFYNFLKEYVGDYRVTKEYTDADIERVIINHEGDTIPGFPSADVFVSLISPQLDKIRVSERGVTIGTSYFLCDGHVWLHGGACK